jgi:hypothetical protein
MEVILTAKLNETANETNGLRKQGSRFDVSSRTIMVSAATMLTALFLIVILSEAVAAE